MPQRKHRILVIEQNPLIRDGLMIVLGLQPDMELAGTALTGPEGVAQFRELRPDVTVVDLDLPMASGLSAIREIRKIDPDACIYGAFTYKSDKVRALALSAGARACVTKDCLDSDFLALVRG